MVIETNCSSIAEVKSRLNSTQLLDCFTNDTKVFRIKIKDEGIIAYKKEKVPAGLPSRVFKGNIAQNEGKPYIIGRFVFPTEVYIWTITVFLIWCVWWFPNHHSSIAKSILEALFALTFIVIILLIGYLSSKGREKDLLLFLQELLTYTDTLKK